MRIAHAPGYRSIPELVQVTALADPVGDNLQQMGQTLAVPPERRYADHRQMLEHAELDAVTIATPHHLHAAHAMDAAAAGVAVISEKPMATSVEEAQQVLAAVERHGVPYAVVHNFLFTPGMERARALLAEGVVGTPFFGRAKSLFNKTDDRADPRNEWRASRAAGGGAFPGVRGAASPGRVTCTPPRRMVPKAVPPPVWGCARAPVWTTAPGASAAGKAGAMPERNESGPARRPAKAGTGARRRPAASCVWPPAPGFRRPARLFERRRPLAVACAGLGKRLQLPAQPKLGPRGAPGRAERAPHARPVVPPRPAGGRRALVLRAYNCGEVGERAARAGAGRRLPRRGRARRPSRKARRSRRV